MSERLVGVKKGNVLYVPHPSSRVRRYDGDDLIGFTHFGYSSGDRTATLLYGSLFVRCSLRSRLLVL